MKIRRVKKRDGREVPFEKVKISDAVSRAQAAVGASDPHFAAEVADVVEMALARRYPQGRETGAGANVAGAPQDRPTAVPSIEEIQDLVEQALIELGHAVVAKAYILYRDRRARLRAALQVRVLEPSAGERNENAVPFARKKHAPRVQVSGGVAAWSKGRIVVALMNEAELPRATAEQVASRVEERVFDSGFKRISTALIRELVDNELVELGLEHALRRQRPVVLARHDLRRLLADAGPNALANPRALGASSGLGREPLGAANASEALGGALVSRFALEDVLPEAVAEAHLTGEIHFEDLRHPHLALSQSVPCDLLLAHDRPQAAFELLERAAQLAQGSAYGIVLEDAQVLFAALVRGTRASAASRQPAANATRPPAGSSTLGHFLLALSATARASGRSIDLAFAPLGARDRGATQHGAKSGGAGTGAAPEAHAPQAAGPRSGPSAHLPAWLPRLIEELAELAALSGADPRTRLARLFVEGDDLAQCLHEHAWLRPAVERLLADGFVVPTWSVPGERFAGPGLVRGWRERSALVCGGACAVNLARAARRAGPWREDALLENAARAIETALDGLVALHEVQRRERWLENAQAGLVRGRVSYAIVPVGMREALRFVADGELRPEQAARLAAFFVEAVQRFSKARGLAVVTTAWFGEPAAVRFAALDKEYFQVSQPLLFEDAARADGGRSIASYSTGFDLSAAGGVLPAGSVLEAAEAALCAAHKSGALHPPQILRALAQVHGDERPSVLAAWERLERTRSRLRSGAWALYALPNADDGRGGGHATTELAPSPRDERAPRTASSAMSAPTLYGADDDLHGDPDSDTTPFAATSSASLREES